MRSSRGTAWIALVAVFSAGLARAQTLMQDLNDFASDTGQYNLVAIGDVTLNGSSDTQGGIAVGGSLSIGGSWTIASQSGAGADPSLYVAGSVSLSGVTYVNNGYASLPGLSSSQWTWNSGQKVLSENSNSSNGLGINASGSYASSSPLSNPKPSGWNWSTLQSKYESISNALGNATATGTISVDSGQNLVFTPPSGQTGGVVVFDLDASKLSGNTYEGSAFSNIQIDVPAGVNYVINVVNLACDQTLFGSGVNFNSGANDDQVLWNFVGSSSNVTIGGGGNFYGSILAPTDAITDNTTIDGQVVASSFVDNGVELHDDGFTPTQVLVPESGGAFGWAAGLCAAVAAARWRRPRLRRC